MRRLNVAGKRQDTNQAAIVEQLRALGYAVCHLGDPVDLLVGWEGGIEYVQLELGASAKWVPAGNLLCEVKNKRGKLTPGQVKFFEEWPGPKAIVHSLEEALAAIAATKEGKT